MGKKGYTNLVVAEKCKFCTSEHSLDKCEKFTKLNLVNKNNFVHSNNFCLQVCLSHHSKNSCKSTIKCTQCKGSHHTLLHEVKQQKTSTTVHHIYNSATDKKAICLPTALIRIQNQAGVYELMRVLIDQCSQSTIITENAAQTLRLPK
jgi:hypothetical protein